MDGKDCGSFIFRADQQLQKVVFFFSSKSSDAACPLVQMDGPGRGWKWDEAALLLFVYRDPIEIWHLNDTVNLFSALNPLSHCSFVSIRFAPCTTTSIHIHFRHHVNR